MFLKIFPVQWSYRVLHGVMAWLFIPLVQERPMTLINVATARIHSCSAMHLLMSIKFEQVYVASRVHLGVVLRSQACPMKWRTRVYRCIATISGQLMHGKGWFTLMG